MKAMKEMEIEIFLRIDAANISQQSIISIISIYNINHRHKSQSHAMAPYTIFAMCHFTEIMWFVLVMVE